MTAEAAAEVIERLAVAAGLSGDWSGHSLRRGFATAARAAGRDPLEIARAARDGAQRSARSVCHRFAVSLANVSSLVLRGCM